MMVVAGDLYENDVVFIVEGTANLLLDFENLKKSYIEPAIHYFNGEIPVESEYSFGDEYGPNQYGLVVYGTIGHTPEPAVQYVRETRNAKQMLQFLDEVRFEGGGCEECSLLAEALSIALQIFDERTLQRGQGYKGIVRQSCIVVCNSPPFGLPSRECADDYYDKTVEQLAEEMGQKKGIYLSIIAPRKIPALQRAFERSLIVDSKSVLSKDYSKDPNHLVCIQGLNLPVTRKNDSQADVSKNGAHMADMKPVVTPSQMTASVTLKESPEKAAKKQKTMPRQPSLPENKLPQPTDQMVSMTLGGLGATQSMPPVNMMVNTTQATPAAALSNNTSAAQQQAEKILQFAMGQTLHGNRPTAPTSAQSQPSSVPDVINSASGAWPQTPATQPARPVPGAQAVSSDNPPVTQRALAWSGQLEWQDTIRDPNGPQQRITRSLACHASVVSGDTLKVHWPQKLIMQLIPQNLLSTLGPLLQNSKTVAFHFAPNDQESLRALHRVMASHGVKFAGCVHFPPAPQCDVKVLLLIFSPKKRAFVGLIPNEQIAFVEGIRSVVQKHKMEQVAKVRLHQQRMLQLQQQQQQQLRQQQQQQQQPQQQPQQQANFAAAAAAAAGMAAQGQFPQQQSQVSQQPMINSGGNALMTSATQGLGQNPEGLVTSAQSSVAPNMGLTFSGVNTGAHNMSVLSMDQSDNAAALQYQAAFQELQLKQQQQKLLQQQQLQQQQQQQQQQTQQLTPQQILARTRQFQQLQQQQQQQQQQSQQQQTFQTAQDPQVQQMQSSQGIQSLRHLLQVNQAASQQQGLAGAQQQGMTQQQWQLLQLQQQQRSQGAVQMPLGQVQMTQAQMGQTQTPMSQGQVTQAQMQVQQQQQLSQSQSSFLPDNMSLLDIMP